MVTYHFAFCTKYRYDVLKQKMVTRSRQLLEEVAMGYGADIQGTPKVDEDFVAVRVRCSEDTPLYELQFALKGKLSVYLQSEYPELHAIYHGRTMFDRSFFRSGTEASNEELDAWKGQHPKHSNP